MQPVIPRNAARGTKARRIEFPVWADIQQLRSSHVDRTVSRRLWRRALRRRGKVGLTVTRLKWGLGLQRWKFNVSNGFSPWTKIKNRHHHSARNLIERNTYVLASHGDPGRRNLSGQVGIFSHVQAILIDLYRAQV
jgi:hypothetical protein